ncbi:hypothetical protein [Nocardia terpenica]|uniref:Uncharacterized protein n=1 Tax=Nocardia terpenica TaxID=455432 RepID=A0A291RVG0_9NOCA|nr:hypothetical protein [Nocardia terpenica]ATL71249.1 hypothetical protein CRH09_38865 [Nocardia terpenica]
MSPIVAQHHDVKQFRELAGRLASLMQSPDRAGSLNQFVEAVASPDMFTDMLIAYAGRWFNETGGQSVLVDPELFWSLSAPEVRATGGPIAELAACAESSCVAGERCRKMLLVCLLETFAQNQWPLGVTGEQRMTINGIS